MRPYKIRQLLWWIWLTIVLLHLCVIQFLLCNTKLALCMLRRCVCMSGLSWFLAWRHPSILYCVLRKFRNKGRLCPSLDLVDFVRHDKLNVVRYTVLSVKLTVGRRCSFVDLTCSGQCIVGHGNDWHAGSWLDRRWCYTLTMQFTMCM